MGGAGCRAATRRRRATPGGGPVQEVAQYLGNTPAVARSSYIDPRVIQRYEDGETIQRTLGQLGAHSGFGDLATEGRPEAAVLRLLRE